MISVHQARAEYPDTTGPGSTKTTQVSTSYRWSPGAAARIVAAGAAATAFVLVAVGLLLTRLLDDALLFRWDESTVESLSKNRSSFLDTVSSGWSRLADAPSIVVVALVMGVVLSIRRRFRETFGLAVALAVELGVFLAVSYTVGRERPTVEPLGSVPSTGSFPSGHVAATIVLYGTIAVLLRRHSSNRGARIFAWTFVTVAAVMVGWARVYRGMHHPLDVVFGGLLGVCVCAIGAMAFADHRTRDRFRPEVRHEPEFDRNEAAR